MLIDTHCHLDFPDFDSDRDFVLSNAKAAGVEAIINVASSLKGSISAVALAKKYTEVFASVGIHPHDAKDAVPEAMQKAKELVTSEKVVAIGEVGLDYYRNLSEPKIQVEIFKKFIELALETRLPLIVHSRSAQEESMAILKEYPALGTYGVVIHCFSGDAAFLKKCLDAGFFVSFTCNVTYKRAQNLRDVLSFVPMDRMFLETDAPFLSPEGKRGKRNEPAYIVELAREVARVKQLDFEKVCSQTTDNAKKFFKIG